MSPGLRRIRSWFPCLSSGSRCILSIRSDSGTSAENPCGFASEASVTLSRASSRRDDLEIDAVVGPSAALANLDLIVAVVPNRAGRVGDDAQGANERERALVDGDVAMPLPFGAAAPGDAQRQRRLGGEQRVEVGRQRRHHKPRQQPDDPRRKNLRRVFGRPCPTIVGPALELTRKKTARNWVRDYSERAPREIGQREYRGRISDVGGRSQSRPVISVVGNGGSSAGSAVWQACSNWINACSISAATSPQRSETSLTSNQSSGLANNSTAASLPPEGPRSRVPRLPPLAPAPNRIDHAAVTIARSSAEANVHARSRTVSILPSTIGSKLLPKAGDEWPTIGWPHESSSVACRSAG